MNLLFIIQEVIPKDIVEKDSKKGNIVMFI